MKKKEIRKEILKLGIPASLEVVFQMLLGLIDMVFVGYLGTYALAGVSLTNQVVSLLLLVYGTVGVGASILISQYYGKGNNENMSIIAGQSLIFGIVIGIVTMFFMLTFATELLHLMGAEQHVIVSGAPFFKIISLSMPISLLNIVANAILRSTGNVKTPLAITSISVIINTVLNYVLIFGIGIIPAYGVIGAAYATLTARIVATTLIIYYLFFINKRVKFHLTHFFTFHKEKLLKVVKLTYPVALGQLIWATGTFIYMILFTRLGTEQLVASQIVTNIESIFIMFSFGISIAGLTLVAKEIGAGNFELMGKKSNEILKIGLVAATLFGLIMFGVSKFIHLIYPQISTEANRMAAWGLAFYAIFQPVKVSNMIMGNGILKSGGITKFIAIVDIVVVFFIGLPTAYLLGIYCGMGFQGIMIGRILEEVSRITIFTLRYKKSTWYKVLAT